MFLGTYESAYEDKDCPHVVDRRFLREPHPVTCTAVTETHFYWIPCTSLISLTQNEASLCLT